MWLVADQGWMSGVCGWQDERKDNTSLQKRDFAALLIGHGENVFQTSITISQFIAPSLFCLDALTASGLFPSVCDTLSDVNTHIFVGIAK